MQYRKSYELQGSIANPNCHEKAKLNLSISLSLYLSLSLSLSLFVSVQAFTYIEIFAGLLLPLFLLNFTEKPQAFYLSARIVF
jgi:hypothetical protein